MRRRRNWSGLRGRGRKTGEPGFNAGALPTGGTETAADTILGSLIEETTGRPISNLTAAKNGPAARGHFNLRLTIGLGIVVRV